MTSTGAGLDRGDAGAAAASSTKRTRRREVESRAAEVGARQLE